MGDVKIVGFAAGLVFAVAFAGYAIYTAGNWTADAGNSLHLQPLVQSGNSMSEFGMGLLVLLAIVVVLVAAVVIYAVANG